MEEVNLRIKSPSAVLSDLQFAFATNLTVLGLKERIAVDYETHPLPRDQKLVYSGKLLKDTDRLRNVLRFEDECSFFTIHLVCRVEPSSLPSSAAPPTLPIPQHEPSLPQPDGLRNRRPVVELPSLAQPMTDEAQQLEAIREMLHGLTAAQGGAGVIQPDPVHYTPEQYIQIQQIYSQYMTLYSQYIQNQPTTAEAVARPPPAGENAPVAAVAADEGPQNNDLLDYAYAVIRVMIMFCVMYVHSSFFRLLFVAGGMLLAYFLQNRNRHQRQQQEVNNNNIQQQQGEEPVVGTNEDSEEEDEEDTEPKPNLLMVAFTFVTTLVSSIIPDHNQVVA